MRERGSLSSSAQGTRYLRCRAVITQLTLAGSSLKVKATFHTLLVHYHFTARLEAVRGGRRNHIGRHYNTMQYHLPISENTRTSSH